MFKIRTSAPKKWNKIYNNANNGGLSWCVNGRPTNSISNVLANCVGYACSRFNEIYNELTDYDGMKYKQLCCNAENFWAVAEQIGLKRGQEPKAGAIMVWQKGKTLSGGDGAGHVAIVERVDSKFQVYTSESGYNSAFFWNATRYKGNGNWGASADYHFLGFIYNPAVEKEEEKSVFKDIKKTDKNYDEYKAIYDLGIMKVDKKGNFNPRKKVTRGALAIILYRVLKKVKVI